MLLSKLALHVAAGRCAGMHTVQATGCMYAEVSHIYRS
jgi:hypothetical protein